MALDAILAAIADDGAARQVARRALEQVAREASESHGEPVTLIEACTDLDYGVGLDSAWAYAEALVQEALERLMRGRTTFVIAHRLSTIRHADRILVFKDGELVEQGTHDDLLSREDGAYHSLHQLQFAGANDGIHGKDEAV